MGWLDIIFTVAGLVLGVVSMVIPFAADLWARRSRRIGFRKQMDIAIGHNGPADAEDPRLGLFNDLPAMRDATLVLLRIENDGTRHVEESDYIHSPREYGLTAEFTGRRIQAQDVTLPEEHANLMGYFENEPGLHVVGPSTLLIPRVPLKPGAFYKILVLLTGGQEGDRVTVTGDVRDGTLHENHSLTPDEKPPVFSTKARWTTMVLGLALIAAVSLPLLLPAPLPADCETGSLRLTGSTAFEPVMKELAQKYRDHCQGRPRITVAADGSRTGVRELALSEGEPQQGASVVAFSDGPRPASYTRLSESRIAVSLFTLVVHDDVRLTNLSSADVRRLYRGEIRDWSQLGGPRLPVVLVSRTSGSGTRSALTKRVLDGADEPPATSDDCVNRTSRTLSVLRCELDSTEQVLETVARTPGALGYTELRAASPPDAPHGLHRLALDGRTPDPDRLDAGGYPYREIEYAYTYGRPPADSPASSFLAYAVDNGTGKGVVAAHGHLPCGTPVGLRVCGKDD
ncbi:PstS family phosphate ABC transporter substrate-binding protein [Streptomyces sp. VRA16 Mangrove soil]|uniref:PstS family phosphate ABC transporter substrate-binding protein n=1 Tax=Streptomyces sp. VRA16 Mangrove soil TaxID=2817434 RepID=UPI001A9EBCD1|nr:substrate-binding domain-containing protein [Streptomyces sp. VRA16 Mangrove soil]MBO1332865.1 substrate-binding domain-containing protein [Streptomyces sp. VRA16 Mangrove soil]